MCISTTRTKTVQYTICRPAGSNLKRDARSVGAPLRCGSEQIAARIPYQASAGVCTVIATCVKAMQNAESTSVCRNCKHCASTASFTALTGCSEESAVIVQHQFAPWVYAIGPTRNKTEQDRKPTAVWIDFEYSAELILLGTAARFCSAIKRPIQS